VKKRTAIKIAIESIERRQKLYAPGHYAHLQGLEFGFAKRDHDSYIKLQKAIDILRIEIESEDGEKIYR
jgi:hypothetical protein